MVGSLLPIVCGVLKKPEPSMRLQILSRGKPFVSVELAG
jgi:hypothetical protein